jgi:hypothetical protein
VSRWQAERIAVRAAGGGRVTEVEREAEHGRPVYKVEVRVGGTEHDLYIDRGTGAVLRHKVDRDDRSGSGSSSSGSSGVGRGSDDRGSDDRRRGSGDRGSDDRGRGSDGKGGDRGRHGDDD